MLSAAKPRPRAVRSRYFAFQETNMLGSIARWTHNVLLTASGLLTLAFLVTAK
jgi:hypothetical protein